MHTAANGHNVLQNYENFTKHVNEYTWVKRGDSTSKQAVRTVTIVPKALKSNGPPKKRVETVILTLWRRNFAFKF
jgi:hypothetical protein